MSVVWFVVQCVSFGVAILCAWRQRKEDSSRTRWILAIVGGLGTAFGGFATSQLHAIGAPDAWVAWVAFALAALGMGIVQSARRVTGAPGLAARLREARETPGLDQQELARRMRVRRATIRQAESGTQSVRRVTIDKWAEETGVPVEELLSEPRGR